MASGKIDPDEHHARGSGSAAPARRLEGVQHAWWDMIGVVVAIARLECVFRGAGGFGLDSPIEIVAFGNDGPAPRRSTRDQISR